MKTYKNVEEWLATNPTKEETAKILTLINRGVFSNLRGEYYRKDSYRRKLLNLTKRMDELGLSLPSEYKETIDKLTKEIDEIKKVLPKTVKRVKKEEVEK